MKHYRHRKTLCPKCGYKLDSATATRLASNRRPKPRDVSFCLQCAALLQYGDGFRLAVADEATIARDDPEFYRRLLDMRRHIVAFNLERFGGKG